MNNAIYNFRESNNAPVPDYRPENPERKRLIAELNDQYGKVI